MRLVAIILLLVLVVVIAVGFIIFSVTNPSKAEFLEWYKESILFDGNEKNFIIDGIKKLTIDDYINYISKCTKEERHIAYTVFIVDVDGKETKYSGLLRDFIEIK